MVVGRQAPWDGQTRSNPTPFLLSCLLHGLWPTKGLFFPGSETNRAIFQSFPRLFNYLPGRGMLPSIFGRRRCLLHTNELQTKMTVLGSLPDRGLIWPAAAASTISSGFRSREEQQSQHGFCLPLINWSPLELAWKPLMPTQKRLSIRKLTAAQKANLSSFGVPFHG